MKTIQRLLTIIIFASLVTSQATAQAPSAIPYQAVARNASNIIIANQNISVRFSIHNLTAIGSIVYSETHFVTTNSNGLFSLNIGQGSPVSGSFATINWGNGAKFIQVEMDPAGGGAYVNTGTQQMMSVPYALQSGSTSMITANLYGSIGNPIPTTINLWEFFGPSATIFLNGNQRVVMNVTCALGKNVAGTTSFNLDIGYQLQPSGAITNASNFSYIVFNPVFTATAQRNCYTMTGSFKPAAGTYKIGSLIFCSVAGYLNNNDYSNGYYMIINE